MGEPSHVTAGKIASRTEAGLLDIFQSAPCIWEFLEPLDMTSFRCCSRQTRALHDAACTALHIRPGIYQTLPELIVALRAIIERGCRPLVLTVTAAAPFSPQFACEILDVCARTAKRVSLRGQYHHPVGVRSLADAAPCLQHLTLDLYDTAASQGADSLLRAAGGRLTVLELHMYSSAVLPCDGLRSCTALEELRLQLSVDRSMHIGPFKYGFRSYANRLLQRHSDLALPAEQLTMVAMGGFFFWHRPLQSAGLAAAIEPPPAAPSATPAGDGDAAAVGGGAGGTSGCGDACIDGGSSSSDNRRKSRAVPPAVAAIASLTQLRCLELYGTSIVRVLDPPNRLSGLSALRNLSRLRVDLPVNTEDRYPSSATFAAATPDSAGAWCLAPTLATLTWLQDLDLGASYTVPPDALPSLEALSKLSRLCCGTLIAPPRQYRRRMHPYELHHLQEEDFQQQEEQLQQWPFVRLPLPASLEQLQVASLPTAPVLAAIAALPNIKVLTLTGRGVPGAAVTRGGAGSGSLRPGGGNTAVEGQKAGSATGPACGGASSSSALHTCEPLRLTLADEPSPREYEHLAAARMVDEVAVAAVLLRRLLPPSLLRRVALQPYSWLPTTKLQGPHAAWLSELAPLGEVVEAVELVAFALGPGDLAALRAALPNLKMLSLYVCRLDADDIRHLQDVPSLALRVDASCEYACMYGNEYDAAGLDAGSEDFVDEAEAQDLDPDHQGLWPVAAELQWAYERALDATDDEEGEGEEEGGELAEAEEGEADQAASDAWVG